MRSQTSSISGGTAVGLGNGVALGTEVALGTGVVLGTRIALGVGVAVNTVWGIIEQDEKTMLKIIITGNTFINSLFMSFPLENCVAGTATSHYIAF
jgi:hypothetical protein